jgi:HSP20 family protein
LESTVASRRSRKITGLAVPTQEVHPMSPIHPSRQPRFSADEFQRELDRTLSEFLGGRESRSARRQFVPPVDVVETPGSYRIEADLPGFSEDEIEVTLSEGVLVVRGRRRVSADTEREQVRHSERVGGEFERSFQVPRSVDPDTVSARLDGGVLTIELPKQETSQGRTVEIEGG